MAAVRRGLASGLLLAMAAATVAWSQAQPPPRPPGGFQRGGQQADPAELSAYQAALGQQNPSDRVSALQQFLAAYPNSGLSRMAVAALMNAQSQMRSAQPTETLAPNYSPPASASPATPSPQPLQIPRDSLLQQAPKQAHISVDPHGLAIQADNSALSEILRAIAAATGMKVDGLSKDERVFGSYGPGEAREVLLSLLEGSGYNVLMVGDLASGAPRELSLSQRAAAAPSSSAAASRSSAQEEADDDQDVQQAPEPQPVQPPQSAGQDNGQPQPPRSPQEILQELQRLRQQNPGQNPNQPPPSQGPQP